MSRGFVASVFFAGGESLKACRAAEKWGFYSGRARSILKALGVALFNSFLCAHGSGDKWKLKKCIGRVNILALCRLVCKLRSGASEEEKQK